MSTPSALDDPRSVRRWTTNPFYVLELPRDATWSEVERRAELLREALRNGSDVVSTPVGPRRRAASDVEAAVDALCDPDARLLHELWASVPPRREPPPEDTLPAWPAAMTAFGWRSRP